jgi:uncharacterized membrane protein
MVTAGILLGLGSALAHSGSYIFTRMFVTRRRQGVLRLLGLGHVIMGIICAAVLAVLWGDDVPAVRTFIFPLMGWVVCYLSGQAALFTALRWTDASRISPLLALKIVVLGIITATILGGALSAGQWGGIALAVAGAFVLNYTGEQIPVRTVALVCLACVIYALADLNILRLLAALGSLGKVRASILGTCMGNAICGVIGLVLLVRFGRGTGRDLAYALPFAISWLLGMGLIFGCFACVGVVFGNILQSTRGLFSILIGAQLARLGMLHLEQRATRGVLVRRLAAAGMMTAAVAIYLLG